jgi:hypothetical protein
MPLDQAAYRLKCIPALGANGKGAFVGNVLVSVIGYVDVVTQLGQDGIWGLAMRRTDKNIEKLFNLIHVILFSLYGRAGGIGPVGGLPDSGHNAVPMKPMGEWSSKI